MYHKVTEFGIQVLSDPEKAKARILEALETVGGNRSAAARRLGIRHRTLMHHIENFSMLPEIQARWPRPGMQQRHITSVAYVMADKPDSHPESREKDGPFSAVSIDTDDI